LRRLIGRFPLFQYLAAIVAMSVAVAAGLVALMHGAELAGWRLQLLVVLALVAGSELASAIANWLSTLLVTPQLLPRLDYSWSLRCSGPKRTWSAFLTNSKSGSSATRTATCCSAC
jgi:hypothetical protein